MRAVVQHSFGAPDVLKVAEVDKPVPIPSEILVRVHAAGLNPVDDFIRSGAFPLLGEPPFTLGWDVSGVVESVVPGVTRFRAGDEVFGMVFFPRPGNAYAEYVAAPSRQFARKPVGLAHEKAAALPLAGLTAWQSLVDTADVRGDQRVLIHGAGGGVGHLAVQIAKARGAYVIGTARAEKHDFLRSLGADELIDYTATDFTEVVSDVDVVLESIGRGYAERSLQVLRPGGWLVTLVERTNQALERRVLDAGFRFAGITVEPDYPGLEGLTDLVERGELVVHVEETFPLEAAAAAHERLSDPHLTGKLVLTL